MAFLPWSMTSLPQCYYVCMFSIIVLSEQGGNVRFAEMHKSLVFS